MPEKQPIRPTRQPSTPTPLPLPPADRYLARHVWRDGRDYGLATVCMRDGEPVIEPFAGETPRTVFVDGDLIISGNSIILV